MSRWAFLSRERRPITARPSTSRERAWRTRVPQWRRSSFAAGWSGSLERGLAAARNGALEVLTLSQLRALLREREIHPRRRWGQNFLVDKGAASRMIEAVAPSSAETVVEIGAGLGALTEGLAGRARRVVAVERGGRLVEVLRETLGRQVADLTIVAGDILSLPLEDLVGAGETCWVVGNLPYAITSPVLEYLLENRRCWRRAYLTVQKEVADRILARPGTKAYGSLSILVQFYTEPERLLNLSPGVFFPRPDVVSSFLLLRMRPRPKADVEDEAFFFTTVRAAF